MRLGPSVVASIASAPLIASPGSEPASPGDPSTVPPHPQMASSATSGKARLVLGVMLMIMAGCFRFRHAKITTARASNFSDRFRIAEHVAPLLELVLSDSIVWRDGRQLDSPIAKTAGAYHEVQSSLTYQYPQVVPVLTSYPKNH
jgi:hypothetical protein